MLTLNSHYYEENTCHRQPVSVLTILFQISLRVTFSNTISLEVTEKYNKSVTFSSVWYTFACWLWKDVLKQGFLDVYLTPSFVVRNFENTFSFSTVSKDWCKFQKWNKKLESCFLDNCISNGCHKFLLLWREY